MLRQRSHKMLATFWLLGALLAGLLLTADTLRPGGRAIVKISGVDAAAYFAVAHSLLLDRDLDLTNQYQVIEHEISPWLAVQPATGRPGAPFPIGYSLLALPFLALGHGLDLALGHGGDARSGLALTFYHLTNPVLLGLGLGFLFLFLRVWAADWVPDPRRRDWLAFLACLWLWPATTLSYLTFSPMTHVSAFMATALFLWRWGAARGGDRPGAWLGVGLAAGLMIICRWQTALFLVVPLLDEAWDLVLSRGAAWRERPGAWWEARLLGAAGLLLVVTPQLLEWKAIYGGYLLVPQGEGFLGSLPRHFFAVLFSSLRGWFVWTPLTLLGVAGLVWASWCWPRLGLPLLLAVICQVSLVGSLANAWRQPHSFGARMLTEALPFVAAGLVVLLGGLATWPRRAVWALVGLCAAFSLTFAVQYRLDLVPKNDRLTFQELLTDKLLLPRAISRGRAATAAQADLAAGRAEAALARLRAALAQGGPDRRLLELLAQAESALGHHQAAAEAQARLAALLERRLY